jgi:hypothetical protein
MGSLRFVGLTCLVFWVVGPFIPPIYAFAMRLIGLDFGPVLSPLILLISGGSHLYGAPFALLFGLVFGLLMLFLAHIFRHLTTWQSAWQRTLFGATAGALVGCAFVFPGLVSHYHPFYGDDFASLFRWWALNMKPAFSPFVLPSLLCGAIVTYWLVPKLAIKHWSRK